MGSNKNSSKMDPREFFSEYGEARYVIKVRPCSLCFLPEPPDRLVRTFC